MNLTQQYRPTKIIINLTAVQQNIRNLQKYLRDDVNIIAVVKANAYGHGAIEVARIALQAGVTMLAVATLEEALHMRQNFPQANIIVLGVIMPGFVALAAENNIIVTVPSVEWLQDIIKEPCTNLQVHIKVDSGMHRIGVTTATEIEQICILAHKYNIHIDGVFTHFATADEESTMHFDRQMQKFEQLLKVFPTRPRLVHAANTATAIVRSERYQFDAVRYGISMYGLTASPYVTTQLPFPLFPALSLETSLVQVKFIAKGGYVGYGATYEAPCDMWLGILPIGYADGLLRGLQGQEVLIQGKRYPIIGRICMDQCMVALDKSYKFGEQVTLIGSQKGKDIAIDEWAERLGTINYEIICSLNNRIPRTYDI